MNPRELTDKAFQTLDRLPQDALVIGWFDSQGIQGPIIKNGRVYRVVSLTTGRLRRIPERYMDSIIR